MSPRNLTLNTTAEAVSEIKGHLSAIRALLPNLITLANQERRDMAKMGLKSVGFMERSVHYMGTNPEFLPGFVTMEEVKSDQSGRSHLLEVAPELRGLHESLQDTLMAVSSELWLASLAFYQNVRQGARRGLPGAEDIYNDLRARFPGAVPASEDPAPAAAAAA